jgi:hypothetical protein
MEDKGLNRVAGREEGGEEERKMKREGWAEEAGKKSIGTGKEGKN